MASLSTTTITVALAILYSAASVAGQTAAAAAAPAACRDFTLLCTGYQDLDNCNITRYRQYIAAATSNVLVSAEVRLARASLKSQWSNATGSCYIEAIVGSEGELLYIRFGNSRSLLTGSADTAGWRTFRQTMSRYEAMEDGMQLVMDVNGQAICPQLRTPHRSPANFVSRILARFARRAVISHVPMDAYVDGQFELQSFDTESGHLRLMQTTAGSTAGASFDIHEQLKVSRKHPLTLWIYKCPARLGIKELQCNSEEHLYIFLRQWINSTAQFVQEEDSFSNSDWRPRVMRQDVALIVLVSTTSVYIVFHITCLTWIGLANASSVDDF